MSNALVNVGWLLAAGLLAGGIAYGGYVTGRFLFAEAGLRRLITRLARYESARLDLSPHGITFFDGSIER